MLSVVQGALTRLNGCGGGQRWAAPAERGMVRMAEWPDRVVAMRDVLARLDRLIADLQEMRTWLIRELEDAEARAAR